jgi:hypothetical protein
MDHQPYGNPGGGRDRPHRCAVLAVGRVKLESGVADSRFGGEILVAGVLGGAVHAVSLRSTNESTGTRQSLKLYSG